MHEMAVTLEEMAESLRKDMGEIKKLADSGRMEEIKRLLSKYKL